MKKTIVILILISLTVYSCQEKRTTWTSIIKQNIVEDASRKSNRMTTANSRNGLLYESYYLDSILLYEKGYSTKHKRYITKILYGNNPDFQLRQELCPDGHPGTENIVFKGKTFGKAVWLYCDSTKMQEGRYFAGEKFGTWKVWNSDGTLRDSTFYGRLELMDSLEIIKYYR